MKNCYLIRPTRIVIVNPFIGINREFDLVKKALQSTHKFLYAQPYYEFIKDNLIK